MQVRNIVSKHDTQEEQEWFWCWSSGTSKNLFYLDKIELSFWSKRIFIFHCEWSMMIPHNWFWYHDISYFGSLSDFKLIQIPIIFLIFWLKYFCCFNPKYFCSAPRSHLAPPGFLCTDPTDPIVTTGRSMLPSIVVSCLDSYSLNS